MDEAISIDPNAPAWWISPQGHILGIKHGDTHIRMVIENPKVFGWTIEKIEDRYHFYGEAVGTEKNAREEIIKDILNKGWIRIRKNKYFYTIQLAALSERAKDYISDWAAKMVDWVGPMAEAAIYTTTGDEQYTIADLAGGILYTPGESKINA
ncbi:hypothetical protein AGMMS49944_14970 [Spirochaetia bacterium]|nr:hypothetical protein AGMMS49944_14970 [Spirochaetia bacterium]